MDIVIYSVDGAYSGEVVAKVNNHTGLNNCAR